MNRLAVALLLAGIAACGVKAPPRPPGASAAPPSDLFKPAPEPGPVLPAPITVGPQAPDAPPAEAGAPAAPPPAPEPKP